MDNFITFDKVCKYYQMGPTRIAAADHISFEIGEGEFCVIVGPSGAGKTTVLNMLGGMDTCDEGRIMLDGAEISGLSTRELTRYRRYDVGFVFQFYNLVQNLTALENVELASEICREPLDPREVLREVGLQDRINNFPAQLPAVSSSAFPSPVRCAKTPRFCCATSRPAHSTIRRANQCWRFCSRPAASAEKPSSSSRTTRPSPPWQTASSISKTARRKNASSIPTRPRWKGLSGK